jgi:hypothetical protein
MTQAYTKIRRTKTKIEPWWANQNPSGMDPIVQVFIVSTKRIPNP